MPSLLPGEDVWTCRGGRELEGLPVRAEKNGSQKGKRCAGPHTACEKTVARREVHGHVVADRIDWCRPSCVHETSFMKSRKVQRKQRPAFLVLDPLQGSPPRARGLVARRRCHRKAPSGLHPMARSSRSRVAPKSPAPPRWRKSHPHPRNRPPNQVRSRGRSRK